MTPETQLSQVITPVTAPALLLGSVATYTSVRIARMNPVIDRSHGLNAIGGNAPVQGIPQERYSVSQRSRSAAILLSTIDAITTSVLVMVAFVSAYSPSRTRTELRWCSPSHSSSHRR